MTPEVLFPAFCLIVLDARRKCDARFGVEQISHDANGSGGVGHMHYSVIVGGSNLHRGMNGAGCCSADEQRRVKILTAHFFCYMHHFIKRRCDQPAQADHVDVLVPRRGK